ncbi:MAG: hypothetical protein HRU40_20155, partial [Saprospiraceae bacterium]|nr:hypothetical protein [Saprospiraceae bacterium]
LEKRLDQHQRRSRLTLRRHTAMAAAVLFLIGFTFLISFTLGKQSVFQGGMVGPVSVVEFEELSSEDTDLRSIQAVAIARKYIQTNDHYIQEGESNQKLRVKMQ